MENSDSNIGVRSNINQHQSFVKSNNVLKQLDEIEIIISVKMCELVQFRNLRQDALFTLNEIHRLEDELMNHFRQQLEMKQNVEQLDCLPDLQLYPSLKNLLTVVGIDPSLTEMLQKKIKSFDELLKNSDQQLQALISEADGSPDDSQKLISALSLLVLEKDEKTGQWLQSGEQRRKPSSAKSHDGTMANNDQASESFPNSAVNEPNIRKPSNHYRTYSESSGFVLSEGFSPRTFSNADAFKSNVPAHSNHSRDVPSSSSSCVTPPTPLRGSRTSLDDSAFVVREQKAPSGATLPRIAKTSAALSNAINSARTPPVTPGTPHKTPHRLASTSTGELLKPGKNITRSRVSSTGARPTYSTTLVPPFSKLKPSKSSEWHFGNNVLAAEQLTASSQSLSSIATLPPPSSSKHNSAKPTKKHKKKPRNLILNDNNAPNFINISATRRSSTTVPTEGAHIYNTSPLSPRTPMTPVTPYTPDLLAREREILSSKQPSPKTPKAHFKTFRNFFKRKKKLHRPSSTEEILDADATLQSQARTSPRRSSETRSTDMIMHSSLTGKHLFSSGESSPLQLSRRSSLTNQEPPVAFESTLSPANGSGQPSSQVASEDSDSDHEKTLTEDDAKTEGRVITNLFRQQSMMNSEEWDIPYDQLEFTEKIGRGRFGTVFRGKWHGDVAIRVIDVSHDEEKLQAFKQKILIYKKTRHENLELFMGSCMDPPRLAIVTGFCRGNSLYNFIRTSKSQTISVNSAKIIAQHIVQGMGYLHSKGIIHKDLKSKNIFVDGKRVVITDFGLVGLHAVLSNTTRAHSMELVIPDGWLCYLAPEVIRVLRCPESDNDDVISTLPYTNKSDVYAFGTVWYELLSGSWPFKGLSAESTIWQAGNGKKQNTSQLQGGKDVKDILMQCWSFSPRSRPDFNDNGILGALERLQTQIHRSLSSHPRRGGAISRGGTQERLFEASPLSHTPFSPMHELLE